jgi:hypothetical protein
LLLPFIFFGKELMSQEFNHWISSPGARSAMLSGAVTAGVGDNSAIYYNPAGLANITNSSLSITSDGYYWGFLKVKNGAGASLNLNSSKLDGLPQLVSFIQKVPELPISVTLAVLNRHHSHITTSYRHKMNYDVIADNPGEEVYIGSYYYSNNIREDWAGFGYGKKVNDRIGLGFSTFFTSRIQSMYVNRSADVYTSSIDTSSLVLISNSYFEEGLEYRNIGVLLVLGATLDFEHFKLGLSVTTPRMNIRFITNSELRRSAYSNIPSIDTLARKTSLWQDKVKSVYKSPLSIDFGVELPLSTHTVFYGKISYFAPINKYNIILNDDAPDIIDNLVLPEFSGFNNMVMANKGVVNFAVSLQHHISSKLEGIVGFRTDYNYLDRNEINVDQDFFPGLTYWNLYHLTGGVLWKFEKFDLSLGSSYVFGVKKGTKQFVNLSEPQEQNYLFGIPDSSADASYNQISVFFGFTYFFPRI